MTEDKPLKKSFKEVESAEEFEALERDYLNKIETKHKEGETWRKLAGERARMILDLKDAVQAADRKRQKAEDDLEKRTEQETTNSKEAKEKDWEKKFKEESSKLE